MEKKVVNTKNAPKQLVLIHKQFLLAICYLFSGQIPFDPVKMELVSDDIEVQTEQVLKNIQAILTEANFTLSDVVKTTLFIKDMNDFGKINEVYGKYFSHHKPARACVEVSRLPKDVKIEMELIAIK